MKYLLLLSLMTFFSYAQGQTDSKKEAQKIIDKVIKKHGGKNYKDAHFEYDFRKHHFIYHFDNGMYKYERYDQATDTKDVLTNEGISRYRAGKQLKLSVKETKSFAGVVNSVHYFAFLPYFLNDAAVHKDLMGTSSINGTDYYKIKVTFDEEGGGQDHDDIYIYWINKKDHTLDYLAYSFHVNGGGVRFRSSYNRRSIGGIIFQDYVNYKHAKSTPVEDLDRYFESGELTELSRIELKNIKEIAE